MHLSDLTPTESINGWGPYEVDRSNGERGANDGRTLTLNGVTYAKGLGVHSFSSLTYALDNRFSRFQSFIGVDDEVGNFGSVNFRVLVDGQEIFRSNTLTGSSPTQAIDLDVSGKRTLQLIVDNADGRSDFDHANWADAKLVSAPTSPATLPSISLALAPTAVQEDGSQNLAYTFTRTGDTSSALKVNYTVRGSATNGTDYSGISTAGATKAVTFAAGATSAVVTVNPTADTTVEANETVVLSLAAGTGYTIGTQGAVTGTIRNDDVAAPTPTPSPAPAPTTTSSQVSLLDRAGVGVNGRVYNDNQPVELGMAFSVASNGKIGELKYWRAAEDANDTDVRDIRLWRSSDGALLSSAKITSTPGQSGWQRARLSTPVDVVTGQEYIVSYRTNDNYYATTNFFSPANEAAFDGRDDNTFSDPSGVIRTPQTGGSSRNSLYSYGSAVTRPNQSFSGSNYWVDAGFSPLSTSEPPKENNSAGSPASISLALAPAAVQEDGSANLTYTFTRSGNTSSALSVNYTVGGTAINGSDYTGISTSGSTKTVSFAAGSSNAVVNVNPTADTTVEADETVALSLATGNGYGIGTTGAVIGTISNDDVATPTPPSFPSDVSIPSNGWSVNENNVGLAQFGIEGESLPVYTGPYEIPAGSVITGMRFTSPVSLYQGNITIEKSIFQPTSAGRGLPIVTTTNYNGNYESAKGKVVIRDSEFDGSKLNTETAGWATAFIGVADLQRNYVHGFGSGFALMNTGRQFDSLIEGNYITRLIAFGNPATTGNHNNAFTIRDFSDAQRSDRRAIVRGNRFVADSNNTTSAFFIQANTGRIDNVSVENNLLEGRGYNIGLESNNGGYSNVNVSNNRFNPTGFGAAYVNGGPGWNSWSNNFRYNSANPNGAGAAIL